MLGFKNKVFSDLATNLVGVVEQPFTESEARFSDSTGEDQTSG